MQVLVGNLCKYGIASYMGVKKSAWVSTRSHSPQYRALVGRVPGLNFSNPLFLEPPDYSNHESFPLDSLHSVKHYNPPPLPLNTTDFPNQIAFPLEVREIGISLSKN